MRPRSLAQTIIVLVMFGISLAIFLFFAMRGRFWWGIGGALITYLLLFWLTMPFLSRTDDATPPTLNQSPPIRPPRPAPEKPKEAPEPPEPTVTDEPITIVPEPMSDVWLAEVTDEHGDAVYGNMRVYTDHLYFGRVVQGAVVRLLDLQPTVNKYGSAMIKVRVLHDPRSNDVGGFGTAVWLGVANTSLGAYCDPDGTPVFDPEELQAEAKRLRPYLANYVAPSFIRQPPAFPKGVVISEFGTAVYGGQQAPDADDYLTSISAHTKLILRENRVQRNANNIPQVLIEVTASKYEEEVGLVGWTTLTNTTFADYYDPDTQTLRA